MYKIWNNFNKVRVYLYHLIEIKLGLWLRLSGLYLGLNSSVGIVINDLAVADQLLFQDPATPLMEGIINFHHDLMFILIIVGVFVLWMLLHILFNFRFFFFVDFIIFSKVWLVLVIRKFCVAIKSLIGATDPYLYRVVMCFFYEYPYTSKMTDDVREWFKKRQKKDAIKFGRKPVNGIFDISSKFFSIFKALLFMVCEHSTDLRIFGGNALVSEKDQVLGKFTLVQFLLEPYFSSLVRINFFANIYLVSNDLENHWLVVPYKLYRVGKTMCKGCAWWRPRFKQEYPYERVYKHSFRTYLRPFFNLLKFDLFENLQIQKILYSSFYTFSLFDYVLAVNPTSSKLSSLILKIWAIILHYYCVFYNIVMIVIAFVFIGMGIVFFFFRFLCVFLYWVVTLFFETANVRKTFGFYWELIRCLYRVHNLDPLKVKVDITNSPRFSYFYIAEMLMPSVQYKFNRFFFFGDFGFQLIRLYFIRIYGVLIGSVIMVRFGYWFSVSWIISVFVCIHKYVVRYLNNWFSFFFFFNCLKDRVMAFYWVFWFFINALLLNILFILQLLEMSRHSLVAKKKNIIDKEFILLPIIRGFVLKMFHSDIKAVILFSFGNISEYIESFLETLQYKYSFLLRRNFFIFRVIEVSFFYFLSCRYLALDSASSVVSLVNLKKAPGFLRSCSTFISLRFSFLWLVQERSLGVFGVSIINRRYYWEQVQLFGHRLICKARILKVFYTHLQMFFFYKHCLFAIVISVVYYLFKCISRVYYLYVIRPLQSIFGLVIHVCIYCYDKYYAYKVRLRFSFVLNRILFRVEWFSFCKNYLIRQTLQESEFSIYIQFLGIISKIFYVLVKKRFFRKWLFFVNWWSGSNFAKSAQNRYFVSFDFLETFYLRFLHIIQLKTSSSVFFSFYSRMGVAKHNENVTVPFMFGFSREFETFLTVLLVYTSSLSRAPRLFVFCVKYLRFVRSFDYVSFSLFCLLKLSTYLYSGQGGFGVLKNVSHFKRLWIKPIVHNTQLEIIWTLVPAIILIHIALPSLALLYAMDEVRDPSFIVKVIGNQWYWTYEYDNVFLSSDLIYQSGTYSFWFSEPFSTFMDFESRLAGTMDFIYYMIPLQKGKPRLLEVDNHVIVPELMNIRFAITSSDVLHSWAIPSACIKVDACPGRLNQVCVFFKRCGVFYGQCSEICGVNHAFMPIVLEVVPKDSFVAIYKNAPLYVNAEPYISWSLYCDHFFELLIANFDLNEWTKHHIKVIYGVDIDA